MTTTDDESGGNLKNAGSIDQKRRIAHSLPIASLRARAAGCGRWEEKMVRKLLITAAFVLSSLAATGASWADMTIAVVSGSEGDALVAAAKAYSSAKGIKIEVVQAPYSNLFEKAASAGQTKSGAYDIIQMDDP